LSNKEVDVVTIDRLKAVDKVIGAKQTIKAVDKGQVELVYLAEDADWRIVGPIRILCSNKGITIETIPTMSELGKACGIAVGAAAVAVRKSS
jgi:large subunit ribosomal protein L7A